MKVRVLPQTPAVKNYSPGGVNESRRPQGGGPQSDRPASWGLLLCARDWVMTAVQARALR